MFVGFQENCDTFLEKRPMSFFQIHSIIVFEGLQRYLSILLYFRVEILFLGTGTLHHPSPYLFKNCDWNLALNGVAVRIFFLPRTNQSLFVNYYKPQKSNSFFVLHECYIRLKIIKIWLIRLAVILKLIQLLNEQNYLMCIVNIL